MTFKQFTDAAYFYRCGMFGVSVLITTVSPTNMAKPTEVHCHLGYGVQSGWPKEPCIRFGPKYPSGRDNFGDISWPIMKYRPKLFARWQQ